MLLLLSLASALNQATCFSYSPFANLAEQRYGASVVAQSEVIYFATYIPMSFIGSYSVDRYGLRPCLIAACVCQVAGNWIRWASSLLESERHAIFLGQLVASLGMCIFVNTPPMLSTAWFPPSQRTLSTNIAVNANAAGAALAYLFAPMLVGHVADFPFYNMVIALTCTIVLLGVVAFFESHPPWKPSPDTEEYDWSQWRTVLTCKGFKTTVIVFTISECVVNTMSTLLAKLVRPNGFQRHEAGYLGAEFLLGCMAGGLLFGWVAQKWNLHRQLAVCLILCSISMVLFRFSITHVHGPDASYGTEVAVAVLLTALFLGPLQATCNELGVEAAFPVSENTVAAIQQLCGNALSAVLIPLLEFLHSSTREMVGPLGVKGHVKDFWKIWAIPEFVLAIMMAFGAWVMYRFDGTYRRLTMELEERARQMEDTDLEEQASDDEDIMVFAEKDPTLSSVLKKAAPIE